MKTRRLSTILSSACLVAMLVLSVVPIRSEAAPLSDAQLVKIVGAVDKAGKVRILDPRLAVLLGLTADVKITFKYHYFETEGGISHVFVCVNAQSGYIVVNGIKGLLTYLRVDADLQLIASATETTAPPMAYPYKVLPVREAAELLDKELAAWSNYADNSMDKKPETPVENKGATQ